MSILDLLSKVTNTLVKREDNIRRAFNYLNKFGYLDDKTEQTIDSVIDAISLLQKMGGIKVTGEIDSKTLVLLDQPRCSCPDFQALTENASALPKWGSNNLSWYISGWDEDISKQEWSESITEALRRISNVCNLKFTQVDNIQHANLVCGAGAGRSYDLDGPSGVLAYFQLPNNSNYSGRLSGVFDKDETWIPVNKHGRGIYLVNVACHELSHALGISHTTNPNEKNALMAPFYQESIDRPQSIYDIPQLQARYGKPVTTTSPIPQPTPTPDDGEVNEIVFRVKGKGTILSVDGYRLQKVG